MNTLKAEKRSGTSAENRAQRKPDHAECGRTGLRCSDQRGRL